jgi:galactose oxidase
MKARHPIARSAGILSAAGIVAATLALPAPSAHANSTVGSWGTVLSLPWRPVHSVLLPTGKVMIYKDGGSRIWNPADNVLTTPPNFSYNSFCNGHSLMADGKVFFSGGHISGCNGLPNASIYDPVANTWQHLPNMNKGRWYPSQVTLANGDIVTMSGDDENKARNLIPQVWQVGSSSWRTLSSASLSLSLYPAAFLAPNGKVFVATSTSRYLDTAGSGSWTTVANRIVGGRDNYGSACMYEPGKVLYTGGADAPVATTESIDLNAGTPAWSAKASMPQARRQHNCTILPDGRVMVNGGSSSAGFDTADGAKAAIVWNPANNTWTTWATEAVYRGYHSETVLLPDARVASIGGNNQSSLQVFSPPYLFVGGTRPVISSAPASVNLNQTFFVGTSQATSITKVTFLRLSAVTHTKNMNQRFNNLSFTQGSGGLNVTAPANANVCPPGHYMLFLINSSGYPSVAAIVKVN